MLSGSFGFKLFENDLKRIKDIYNKYMSSNDEVKNIVRTLKEIFKKRWKRAIGFMQKKVSGM